MSQLHKHNSNTYRSPLTIGLFGYGVVGQGLYEVLQQTPGLQANLKKICIKNIHKPGRSKHQLFTTNAEDILSDSTINTVVELIDDADAAFEIVQKALQAGKQVVTANKKMVAENFERLLELQKKHNSALLYEAACCAGIPIIRNLEEYYDNDSLSSITGIVNGSTNFIVSKIFEQNLSFENALITAQQLGFAESNPDLDIDGHDAVNKLCILISHAFGRLTKSGDILSQGIRKIQDADVLYAKQNNYLIKLVATAIKLNDQEIAAFVLPQFVNASSDLYSVQNEYNGIITESHFADRHFFKGKGAGAYPTAAAVLSDLSALRYQYKYEYKKINLQTHWKIANDYYLKIYVSASRIDLIPKEDFEWIEEWHNEHSFSRVLAVIHIQKLLKNDWWRAEGISLILCEEPIADNVAYKKISKRSLALAGVF